MPFEIDYTRTAASMVRSYRKYEQQIILDAVDEQLQYEPTTETKKRKRLGKNPPQSTFRYYRITSNPEDLTLQKYPFPLRVCRFRWS